MVWLVGISQIHKFKSAICIIKFKNNNNNDNNNNRIYYISFLTGLKSIKNHLRTLYIILLYRTHDFPFVTFIRLDFISYKVVLGFLKCKTIWEFCSEQVFSQLYYMSHWSA
uniref:Uncharacterized protein n=1 Tax=Sipha flava TaxID=143950 RepID=A0A2S2R6F3_9HEMI